MLFLQLAQMRVVPPIRQIDQPFVDELLAYTALPFTAEDDRLSRIASSQAALMPSIELARQ